MGTPVVVKMDNPNNWSMVEIEGPLDDDDDESSFLDDGPMPAHRRPERSRNKNAKQLTWVLLLKAHRAAGCLTSLAAVMLGLAAAIRRRVAAGITDTDKSNKSTAKSRLYFCIKAFLWVSVILLGFEVAAYLKGWHFGSLQLQYLLVLTKAVDIKGVFGSIYSRWVLIRVEYLAPPLQSLTNGCIVLFLVQSLDRVVLCLGCLWIKLRKIKPVPKGNGPDPESGEGGFFPMVLVQIPMCNEKEVEFFNAPYFFSNFFELETPFPYFLGFFLPVCGHSYAFYAGIDSFFLLVLCFCADICRFLQIF